MKHLFAALILITAMTSKLGAAPMATVMVRPNAETAAANAVLADIATVQCADKSLVQKLEGIQVCSSPLPGKTRVVTKEQILVSLRRDGINTETVEMLCPAEVTLKRTATIITGQSLFDTVKDYILLDGSFPGTVYVEPTRLQADQAVPMGNLELRVKPGTKAVRKGQVSLPVEIVIDGQVYRTTSVSATVKLIAPVLVAKKSINRLDELTDDNTAIEERDVTNLPSDVIYKIDSVGLSANVSISSGSVIRSSMVSAPVAVKSGDIVMVIVQAGTARVAEKGTAVQDGRIGDVVKVRFTTSGREVRGRVSEPGLVQIIAK